MEIKILYDREPEKGPSFENLVNDVLKNLGYVRIHRRQKPAGMELDIEATHSKARKKILCECKAHQDHIGPDDLLYFHGKLRYEIDKGIVNHGMFLSVSGFTANAERWYIDGGINTTSVLSLFRHDDMTKLFVKANLLLSEKHIDAIIKSNSSLEMGKRYLAYYKSELYIIQLLLSTETVSYLILNAKGTIPSDAIADRIGKLDPELVKCARLNPVVTMKVIMNLADLESKSASKVSSELNENREDIKVALGDLYAEKIVTKQVTKSNNLFKIRTDINSLASLIKKFDGHEKRFVFMESKYIGIVVSKKEFLQHIIRSMKMELSDDIKNVIVRAASIFPSVMSFLILGDYRYFTNFTTALKRIRSRKEKIKLKNIAVAYFLNQIYEAILKDTRSAPGSYLRRRNILGYAFDFRINFASQDQIILGLGSGLHVYIANKQVGEVFEQGQIVSPTDHSQNIVLGNHLYTLQRYPDAIGTFDVVTKYSSNSEYLYAAWIGKSQCYRMMSDSKREIRCINKALTYKRGREGLSNKLLYLETMGKTDEAREVRNELSKMDPSQSKKD